MKNLTTPQAVLGGLALIALAVASIPYSSNIVTPAHAKTGVQKVQICNPNGVACVRVVEKTHQAKDGVLRDDGYLMTATRDGWGNLK